MVPEEFKQLKVGDILEICQLEIVERKSFWYKYMLNAIIMVNKIDDGVAYCKVLSQPNSKVVNYRRILDTTVTVHSCNTIKRVDVKLHELHDALSI